MARQNLFELTGDGGLGITYSTDSITGQSQLTYRSGTIGERTFTGADIRTEQSELGELVTVTLERTSGVDAVSTNTLTVLLPMLPEVEIGDTTTFESLAIFASSMGGPDIMPTPPHFEVKSLHGMARAIES